MSRNRKLQAGDAWSQQKNISLVNNNKTSPKDQPGTALTAFLKRYKFDLLLLSYTPHISRLVEVCDIFLSEADRGES